MTGFVDFEPGQPEGEVRSEIGANNSWAVVDDLSSRLYRNAQITVLNGSPLDAVLNALAHNPAHGAGDIFTYCQASNSVNAMGTTRQRTAYMIHCYKKPAPRAGFGVQGNDKSRAQTIYTCEMMWLSTEQI